jgi:hypothetical protein
LSWPGAKFPDGGELATGVDVPLEPEPINADRAEKNLTGRAGDELALLSATLSLLLVASAGANGPMKESWAWCAGRDHLNTVGIVGVSGSSSSPNFSPNREFGSNDVGSKEKGVNDPTSINLGSCKVFLSDGGEPAMFGCGCGLGCVIPICSDYSTCLYYNIKRYRVKST